LTTLPYAVVAALEVSMRRVAFAIAGLVMLGAGPAMAQYGYPPRPAMSVGGMPPEGVFQMVRQMGLEPVGPPVRNGPVYFQRAADYYGKPLRVVIDANRAQVVSVEAIGGPPAMYRGPYASTGGPYWRRPYSPYGVMPPDDDDDYAPPGLLMAPHGQPPQPGLPAASQAKPKSAAVTPARPPVPRKRPAAAPQEAAGSVEPIAPSAPAAAPPPPAKPATPEMTPVAPLN
jgi:hypothetical protein